MLRIKINTELINFVNIFSNTLFDEREKKFKRPLTKLDELKSKYTVGDESYLLEIIIKRYNEILKLTPKQQQHWVNYIDKYYSEVFYKKHIGDKNKKATEFSNDIVEAMRYDEFRASETHKIINKIKVRSCVYCNSQLAIVIDKGAKRQARFELDHYFPKSKYPFLCTSFFNLIPSCSNCNKGKSSSDVNIIHNFHLYTEFDELSLFEFKLENSCIAEYLINNDKSVLKLEFNDLGKEVMAEIHNQNYSIIPIYNTQLDIAEELLWKYQCYTKAKKKDLRRFGIMFPNQKMIDRMIVGNYVNSNEIHNRPLAKFTQDLAKQLGLISKPD